MWRPSVDNMRLGHAAPQGVQTATKLGYHTAGNDLVSYEPLGFFFRKTRDEVAGSIEHARHVREQDKFFRFQGCG